MAEYKVARFRLKRAITHGENLAKLWNEVPSGRLCTPRAIIDRNGYGQLIASNVGEIPEDLPLLLGEMLYQLRSALDSCIYQATVYATQDPPTDEGKLEYPITTDKKEWPGLVKRRLMHLSAHVVDTVEKTQPYHKQFPTTEEYIQSPSRSLGILHELARKDRHRTLHVIGSLPVDVTPSFILPHGVTVDGFKGSPPSILKEGTIIGTFHLSGYHLGDEAMVNPKLRTSFGCAEPPLPCDPSDTFERRLREMVNTVASIIDFFEGNT